ncbi:WXG100 family type VII secretion target [Actinophytocola sediminis]
MVGQTSDSSDYYVSGGVNWAGFSLAELVAMVAEQANPAQLERLAQDWRSTGDAVVDAADYLAEALDDLMNYWTGESANKARSVVALNAQWVSDLGTTAREMGTPIDDAAGALQAAQAAMPALPVTPPPELPGAAPAGAAEAAALTGSPVAAAIGATSAGSTSGFAAHAEQAELKQVAVETMQRFETAAVGIDRTTPRFLGPDSELRPDPDGGFGIDPGEAVWISTVTQTTGVDMRWQVLTGMTDPSSSGSYPGGGLGGGGGGFDPFTGRSLGGTSAGIGVGAMPTGSVGGRTGQGSGGRPELAMPGRGMPTAASGAVIGGGNAGGGMPYGGHMGGAPIGAGAGMGTGGPEPHRRRFPFDADDPFDTGQKASPPVIGL